MKRLTWTNRYLLYLVRMDWFVLCGSTRKLFRRRLAFGFKCLWCGCLRSSLLPFSFSQQDLMCHRFSKRQQNGMKCNGLKQPLRTEPEGVTTLLKSHTTNYGSSRYIILLSDSHLSFLLILNISSHKQIHSLTHSLPSFSHSPIYIFSYKHLRGKTHSGWRHTTAAIA